MPDAAKMEQVLRDIGAELCDVENEDYDTPCGVEHVEDFITLGKRWLRQIREVLADA